MREVDSKPENKIWNWYVSRPNEIFVDLDSKRSIARAFSVLRRGMASRLHGGSIAVAFGPYLDVDSIWFYPSGRVGHAHLIVCLKEQMDPLQRALWALWMGSDRIRGVYVIERLRNMVIAADVFSTRGLFEFRYPDDRCTCPEKHKAKAITDKCPAMQRLMMDQRSADYFPRNTDRKKRGPLVIPWGRVSRSSILKWK